MLKKDILGNASAKSLTEAFRCGECLHFNKHPHSTRDTVCKDEGVKAIGIAPKCFTPDITKITGNTDQFVQLVSLFQSYTHQERRIFLGLLRASKKKGYPIGTPLYFKIGNDFVSNYLCGFVAGYSSTGELMLMGSPDQKGRGRTFVSFLERDAQDLLTASQWRAKRQELVAEHKLVDPANRVIKRQSVVDTYEPPSIDTVPQSWLDKRDDPGTKRGTKRKDAYEFQVS